eukprot:6458613-Amphidinium_carterae.2
MLTGSLDKSKAAGIAKGKQELVTARKRSENTLHAVGRMMSNEDLLMRLRMISLATNAWSLEYGEFSHAMRSCSETARHYADWSHWCIS